MFAALPEMFPLTFVASRRPAAVVMTLLPEPAVIRPVALKSAVTVADDVNVLLPVNVWLARLSRPTLEVNAVSGTPLKLVPVSVGAPYIEAIVMLDARTLPPKEPAATWVAARFPVMFAALPEMLP